MVKDALHEAEDRMKGAVRSLEETLATIRTGRASPTLVEKLMVDYYDTPTPLMQLASISAPEPRLLTIKPFDATSLKNIEKAIQASDLHLNPSNDGKIIRLAIPPLTEDRRKELIKLMHHKLEDARIAIRNVRRDVQNDLREFEKEKMISEDELEHGGNDLQKLTDKYVEQIEVLGNKKEDEIKQI
jgi:ribosome recycling factor